ncbi:hypothetical protein [Glacieibacterium sp.]|uniref:hypothetical protein n=1 Tax=Glacieibacterium sp. TaxID=2860237 RepID=UPI003B00CC97
MASKSDGLAEILVQLAANSATLIERARANGIFKQAQTVDVTPTPEAPAAAAADDFAGQKSALQEIIVQQAMKIHTLEAEIARLTKAN